MNDIKNINPLQKIHKKLLRFKIYHAATGLFLLYLMAYLVFAILAPLKTLDALKNNYQPVPAESWGFSVINSKTDSIVKYAAMLNSKLLLSENDSICFSINLADSLLNLELKGVTIHRTKISWCKTGRLFSKIGRPQLYKYLSTPFVVENYRSTIVKVPVVIKHAPKDTAEANKIKAVPQLPPNEYVRYAFKFDKPLRIIVEQEEKAAGKYKLRALKAKTGERLKFFGEISSGIFSFKIPEYQPLIRIKIPRDEAKTIFRALPENAAMSLQLSPSVIY